jgi:N-acetylneuraminic acid mutarotase
MKNAIPLSSILDGFAPASRHAATTTLNSMLRAAMLMLLAWLCLPAAAQTGEWTWVAGSNAAGGGNITLPGVYGKLGTPAATNIPGGRAWPTNCTDDNGNFWLFEGLGYDSKGIPGNLNDLWEFNPSTKEWTWMGGNSTIPNSWGGRPGVYGALGTPAAKNVPGGRLGSSCWIDSSGNLWFFGGRGYDAVSAFGEENDLWEFNPSTKEWTWMSGSSTVGSKGGRPGVYGSKGVPAAKNVPGGQQSPLSWIDASGDLWLFGGAGYDAQGNFAWLNDLWEFNPSAREWTWVGGSSSVGRNYGQPGVYGKLGVPAAGNIPGARFNNGAWGITINGDFWLYGGTGADATGNYGDLNDLWEFNPTTKEWAWMSGGNVIRCAIGSPYGLTCGLAGEYGTLETPGATNVPGSREDSAIWVDRSGNLWVFGGGGYDANNNFGPLNDLWEYSPSVSLWVWMGGKNTTCCNGNGWDGVYGTKGTPAATNLPGGRGGGATWTDASGDLWLFGGWGTDASGNNFILGDLWEYEPAVPAAKPTIGTPSGTYHATQTVSIVDYNPGASIYYTLNGELPARKYIRPLTISASTKVVAVAAGPGYSISEAASASYVIK